MRNLTVPIVDPYHIWNEIVSKKRGQRKQRLVAASDQVYELFAAYEAVKPQLETLQENHWLPQQKEDFQNCYMSSTKPLELLKHTILISQEAISRRICSYCGLNTFNQGFDHYLSKEQFPEYAAYAYNLIPCCSECNSKKSSTFLIEGRRQFLSLYFDTLPQDRFLFVDILQLDGEPVAEFYLSNDTNIPTELFELITCHFDRLNLLNRFGEAAPEVFSETRLTLKKYGIDNPTEAADLISTQVGIEMEKSSPNNWRVVLFEQITRDLGYLTALCETL